VDHFDGSGHQSTKGAPEVHIDLRKEENDMAGPSSDKGGCRLVGASTGRWSKEAAPKLGLDAGRPPVKGRRRFLCQLPPWFYM
jgi:hypothetical protein